MFTTAEKSTASPGHIHRQADENRVFFRKAGEEEAVGEQQSAFFSTPVQAKLTISKPDDPQEKEADHVAGMVMRMASPVVEPEKKEEKETVSTKPETPVIQRRTAGQVFRSPLIQRTGRGPPGNLMNFENNLQSSRGNGSPMPATTLQYMESRFDADFSGVRIHTGSYAEHLSTSIHAQAFTHGKDIYFNAGKYSPETEQGGHLLAHELTHTIQQGAVSSGHATGKVSEKIQEKSMISRVPAGPVPQLTHAVEKAKSKEGKVNAAKEGPDGYREGWQDLLEFFKTTFGPDKIISGAGGTTTPGTVAEQDIKKKRMFKGTIVNPEDINGDRITGERDAMPSWCGIFVFWALNKSGVPMPKWQLGKSFIKPEAAYPPGYVPRTGDIAYKEGYSHYAIVESATGSTVTTVNGNTAGEDNLGGQVQTREHPISEWSVFFNPLIVMEGQLGSGEGVIEEKPKTLRELRRELFNVNRRPETENDEELQTGNNDRQVQTKPELSDWSVAPDGSLARNNININTNVNANSGHVQLSGKEEPTETQEEEEKNEEQNGVSNEITVHKQHDLIQNGWFDSALSLVNSAIDYVAEGLEAGKRLILGEARDFVMAIPGYKALRVVLGEDPITGEEIERNGHNFIEAAFDIMPGGRQLHEKLSELGALDEAARWIDNGISAVEAIVDNVVSRVERFWNDLSLDDLASPTQIFRDAGDIIHDTISDVVGFAVDAATELLEIVKKWLLTQIVDFVRERTTAYPLLTVILGKDPVTEAEVERNGTNILNALLELGGEEGQKQRTLMQDTGTFEKVAKWIDRGILVFGNLYQTIRDNFGLIWSVVSIDALMNPVAKFTEIYNTFAQPVLDVLKFVADTAVIILQFIKEVLMKRLSEWAKDQRGYYLLTVILGKNPFTDEKVRRNTENIIRGFMSLMDGGEAQFQQMKESGAIARATGQIDAAVNRLNMTPAYIVQLFMGLWKGFGLDDLMEPLQAFARIFDTLAKPILKLIAFVVEIVKIVVVVILEIMQFPFDVINNIIAKTVKSFHLIKSDPIGFLKNLLNAIKQGFVQFFDNILTHLINGLVGWLTMELKDAGVPELKDLSLKGIIGWVLEVLGISMEKIWEKLAKHPKVGPERVAKIRGMIGKLEGIWSFIKDVQERGMAAIWDKISEQLGNLWNTVLDAVKNWIMEKIITQITVKLLSMLDPTGIMAVINSCIAIYKAVQSFIKYLRQMLEIVNSFVEGIAEIAGGNIIKAASFLERTMARGIPIVIGFLANQVGLTGIGKRIAEMLEKVREMVDKALEWLVNKAVNAGGKLLEMGKAAAGAVMGWIGAVLGLERSFTAEDGGTHRLFFVEKAGSVELMINPDPKSPFIVWINTITIADPSSPSGQKKAQKKDQALKKAREIEAEEAKNAPNEKAEEEKVKTIRKLLDELTALTGPLFAGEKPNCSMEGKGLVFGGLRSSLYGSTMEAQTLTNIKMPAGSVPSVSHHASYATINQRRNQGGSYYILGHLLNHNLGGTGKDWKNLTPLTRDANSAHERIAESRVKNAVDAGNIVHYKVEAVYGRPKANSKDATIRDIKAEEVHVPLKLVCEANLITPAGVSSDNKESKTPLVPAGTVIDNEMGQNDADYDLTGLKRETVYLDSGDVDKIAGIDGVNRQLAQKIVDATEDKETRFGSFDALAGYVFTDGRQFTELQQKTIRSLPDHVKLFQN